VDVDEENRIGFGGDMSNVKAFCTRTRFTAADFCSLELQFFVPSSMRISDKAARWDRVVYSCCSNNGEFFLSELFQRIC
jgi:hypothetical protein